MNIEISIGKSRYKINCEEGQKEKLIRLADHLNKRVNSLSFKMKNIDEKTLLAISALMIAEELENKKGANEDRPEINDEDLYDAVSDNMENVAEYIEKLTKKIENF
jgi:cell division protein ZapA (FtsZ GTPase activity inhibitor)